MIHCQGPKPWLNLVIGSLKMLRPSTTLQIAEWQAVLTIDPAILEHINIGLLQKGVSCGWVSE